MTSPILQIESFSCGYPGRPILESLSFSVSPGRAIGVVGRNAAGKTTLFRALMGRASTWRKGRICFDGLEVDTLGPPSVPAFRVAWALQERPIFNGLEVQEALRAIVPSSLDRASIASRIRDLSDALPILGNLLPKRMEHLSGGERAFANLALALINEPTPLLLDEPAANVSAAGQVGMAECLSSYLQKTSAACVIIEHRVDFLDLLPGDILSLDEHRHS